MSLLFGEVDTAQGAQAESDGGQRAGEDGERDSHPAHQRVGQQPHTGRPEGAQDQTQAALPAQLGRHGPQHGARRGDDSEAHEVDAGQLRPTRPDGPQGGEHAALTGDDQGQVHRRDDQDQEAPGGDGDHRRRAQLPGESPHRLGGVLGHESDFGAGQYG